MKQVRRSRPGQSGLFTALLLAACSTGVSYPDAVSRDAIPEIAIDAAAENSEIFQGAALTGRLVDTGGDSVPEAMLVLCGFVDGKEVCNQGFTGPNGLFTYSGLKEGFSHLNIMPYGSTRETGKLYGGLSLEVSLSPAPETTDLGEIVVPVIVDTQTVVAADGGIFIFEQVTVEVPAGSLAFPDLSAEGDVGLVRVSPEFVPFEVDIVAAFAFHPFAAGFSEPATVRVSMDQITQGKEPQPSAVRLFTNSVAQGGLVELGSSDGDTEVVGQVGELTWLVVTAM